MDFLPQINLEDFNYSLSKERIAEYPLLERGESKLLLADKKSGSISHHLFKEIHNLIPENSLIVLNNTKVIPARLNMQKYTGGIVELLCVEPIEPSTEPQTAMIAKSPCKWKCLIGGKRIVNGTILQSSNHKGLFAKIIEKDGGEGVVEITWPDLSKNFSEILSLTGDVPLPPYIKRKTIPDDKSRYQTVYAEYDGSVAAPTAGLHFTDDILDSLKQKGIQTAEIILHVGPGTFKPIEGNDISTHVMHSELISVSKSTLLLIHESIKKNKFIIATGTTTLRTLESLYFIGASLFNHNDYNKEKHFIVEQWVPYNKKHNCSKQDAFESIIEYLNKTGLNEIKARTSLFIVPGYDFKVVSGLITNYHITKSTLILLVAAFLGKELWKKVYDEAMNNDYRFLSYGDSSLLLS